MDSTSGIDETVEIASRTLRAAGYEVIGFQRTLNRVEFRCQIYSRLGALLRFLFAITSEGQFSPSEASELEYVATSNSFALVLVSTGGADGQVSWSEFLRAMGGAVPSWRALQPNYGELLLVAAQDKLPPGEQGEAWAFFEDLIADGLEFSLGRSVRRFGGRRRGQKVSDMVAQLPNFDLLIVDGKAAKDFFDAGWPKLRALVEYVDKQKVRQNGLNKIIASLIISSDFKQNSPALRSVSDEYLATTGVPLCFMTAKTLAFMVEMFRERPHLRNAIRWRALFTGGLIDPSRVEKLIAEAEGERVESREI